MRLQFPKVLISVLNWNSAEDTICTVNSVFNSEYKNFRIFLIDNNSIDDSVTSLSALNSDVELLALESNLGYAGAHKRAARKAMEEGFDFLWILNNDVIVFPDTLSSFLAAADRHPNSLLGSMSLDKDGETINFGGGAELLNNFINDESLRYNRYQGEKASVADVKERAVSDLEGASFFIPVPVIKRYGFLKTAYFLYGEETDYCYKLRRKYNIQSILVPDAKVIHNTSKSFAKSKELQYVKNYYFTRNIHLVYKLYFKDYKIEGMGGFLHFAKYFFKHYFLFGKNEKDHQYKLQYFKKLGYFHALLRLKVKYLEPNKFYKP